MRAPACAWVAGQAFGRCGTRADGARSGARAHERMTGGRLLERSRWSSIAKAQKQALMTLDIEEGVYCIQLQ